MAKVKAAESLGAPPIAPAPPAPPDPYPYELPRILHKAGAERKVSTPEECEAARADGWMLRPAPQE